MLIPMETLSPMIPRADSGTGGQNRTQANIKSDSMFGKILDDSRSSNEHRNMKVPWKTDDAPADAKSAPMPKKKPEIDMADDDALAAGVVGYQNTIVFVLEGDMESATTPDIIVDGIIDAAAPPLEIDAELYDMEADDVVDSNVQTDTSQQDHSDAIIDPDIAADAQAPTAEIADTIPEDMPDKTAAEAQSPVITGDDVRAALDASIVEPEVIADVVDIADEPAGEVTARRPEIGTSEQRNNEDDNSEFSKIGDLSPLENENDTVSVKGHKEKQNSDTDTSAKNNDGKTQQDSVNGNVLPLTEGIKPERFQADQQMKRAADVPVKKEDLFDEMVSRIETMQSESRQTMTIQLKPEFLGKLALEIAMDASGLHVKINAANNDVRSMINGQINALIESLEHKGIEVVEVEVAYTGVDNGAFKDSSKNQAQPDRPRRSYAVDGIDESAAYFAVFPAETLDYYLDAGVSSVEYRA
ncbi:MAG: flagellar hook-length control protein FliK [Oscillospiraceae bacterium]|nr:flagellar hook-length control protein FliK [Oscillospiraceae bacterium]